MKAKSHWIGSLAVLALATATVPFPVAQAQRVDFERETHFRCYVISQQTPEAAETVTLTDQFLQGVTETPDEPVEFCAPTSKNGLPILEPEEHLTTYEAPEDIPNVNVSTEDQFGPRTLHVVQAHYLFVPTEKEELGFPRRLNHYWCYDATGPRVGQTVTLDDQFGSDTVRVQKPRLFCNPVEKIHAGVRTRIAERAVHLTCYDIFGPQATEATQFSVSNQFETDMFTVTSWDLLCVPSEKGVVTPAS